MSAEASRRVHARIGGRFLLGIIVALVLQILPAPAQPGAQSLVDGGAMTRVLILYGGDPPSDDYAHVHAVVRHSLLAHYEELTVEVRPVAEYREGDADRHLRTFYLGSVYDVPGPDALLRDVAVGAAVTWAGYGVWEVDRVPGGLATLGLRYEKTRGSGAAPGDPSLFLDVTYRDHVFRKHEAATDMVEMQVLRAGPEVPAWASNAAGERMPYVLRSGAFWYVADVPFTYIHETDRYLVFADLLGPMLGHAETCEPRAVVRVEDVDPMDDPEDLRRAFELLAGEGIPFAAAVIPTYVSNPAAREGRSEARVAWTDSPEALVQLRRVPDLGGRVCQHGATHQVPSVVNTDCISGGVVWEFRDVRPDAPLAGPSVEEALARVREGWATLREEDLRTAGWASPHYAFNPAMGPSLTDIYPVAFERRQHSTAWGRP